MTDVKPNVVVDIDETLGNFKIGSWSNEDTAFLIVHGIGNQLPAETIDQFCQGLYNVYNAWVTDHNNTCIAKGNKNLLKIVAEHVIIPKQKDKSPGQWFDNVIRLRLVQMNVTSGEWENKGGKIDIYEYYWANLTENKADWDDINDWLNGVTNGAAKYYRENAELGKRYGDSSPFFTSDGKFLKGKYRLFVSVMGKLVIIVDGLWQLIKTLFSYIPGIGSLINRSVQSLTKSVLHQIANIIGDVVVYNVVDPKSKYYAIHRKVQDGAVNALKFLIEKQGEDCNTGEANAEYPRIILAGHSLGSQIAYDAVNKLLFLVAQDSLECYTSNAKAKNRFNLIDKSLSDQLRGFITFGSPLDKLAFFVRENIPDCNFVRKQILNDFHCFKNRSMDLEENRPVDWFEVRGISIPSLNDIQWRNYYDDHDDVSGGLDYYSDVVNVNCKFNCNSWPRFTHSYYWSNKEFYMDVVKNYLT